MTGLNPLINCMPHHHLTSMLNRSLRQVCVLSLCLALTFTLACAQSNSKNYFPLIKGAKWTYSGNFSSTEGKPLAIHGTAFVEGKTLIHGKEYFKYIIAIEFPSITKGPKLSEDVRYYRVDRDGVHFLSGKNPDGPEILEIPMPIRTGVKWLSGTVEAWAEPAGTIKTGALEYSDCLKITYKSADGVRKVECYFAPGIGLVKAIYTNITEPKSVIDLTLEVYES